MEPADSNMCRTSVGQIMRTSVVVGGSSLLATVHSPGIVLASFSRGIAIKRTTATASYADGFLPSAQANLPSA